MAKEQNSDMWPKCVAANVIVVVVVDVHYENDGMEKKKQRKKKTKLLNKINAQVIYRTI